MLTLFRPKASGPPQGYKYWAFISYSHRDSSWGDWLHRKLETFVVPAQIIGKDISAGVPRRLYPVFRDREELPTAAALSSNIETALRESKYLIVIGSPNAARSLWVNNEIETFKRLGGSDRILCLVVDGEPNASADRAGEECFPLALRYRYDAAGQRTDVRSEPLAADARPGKDGKRNALLKIIAGVLGIDYAKLKDREGRRRARQLAAVGSLVGAAILLFAGQQFLAYRNLAVEHAATERALLESELRLAESQVARGGMLEERNDYTGAKNAYAQAYAIQARHAVSDLAARLGYLSAQEHLPDPLLRFRADTPVSALAVDGTGCCLVTGHDDGSIAVWKTDAGQPRRTPVSTAPIAGLGLIAGSSQAVVVDRLGRVVVVDIDAGSSRVASDGALGTVSAVVVMPNGQVLLAVTLPPAPSAADPSKQEPRSRVIHYDALTQNIVRDFLFPGPVRALALSPDGTSIFVADEIAVEIVFDPGPAIRRRFVGNKASKDFSSHGFVYQFRIDSMAVSADGGTLALGYSDGILEFWDLNTGKQTYGTRVLVGSIGTLHDGNEGKAFLFGDNDGRVRAVEQKKRRNLHRHIAPVVALALTPDGTTIVSTDGHDIALYSGGDSATWLHRIGHDAGMMPTADFSPDSRLMVTHELLDETIHVWSVASQVRLVSIAFDDTVTAAYFVSANELLVALSSGRVFLYDLVKRQETSRLREAGGSEIDAFTLSKNRQRWAVMSGAQVTVADVHGKNQTHLPVAVSKQGAVLTLSHDGSRIAVAAAGQVTVWTAADRRRLQQIDLPPGQAIGAMVLSDDDTMLVTAHEDARLRVWDIPSGRMVRTIRGHEGGLVTALALMPDNRTVISGGFNGDLRFWEIGEGNELHKVDVGPPIRKLTVSPTGVLALGVFGDSNVYGEIDLVLLDSTPGRTLIEASGSFSRGPQAIATRKQAFVSMADWYRTRGRCPEAIRLYDLAWQVDRRFPGEPDGMIDCLTKTDNEARALSVLETIAANGAERDNDIAARLWLRYLEAR